MRDIEFRAKRQDNANWIYGDLVHNTLTISISKASPVQAGARRFYKINPKTIGQYVGKEDINDARIYEGDIVRIETVDNCGNMNGFIGIVVFHDCCFELQNIEDSEVFEGLCFYNNEDLEVIGNIFDNPNLLEVEE